MAKAKIALFETGLMGAPVTLSLLKSGHQLQVWNGSIKPLAKNGEYA